MGSKRYHVHYAKVDLAIRVVHKWPDEVVFDGEGKPFRSLRDAVQAVMDHPAPNVTLGCPSPGDDGKCPGHPCEPRK